MRAAASPSSTIGRPHLHHRVMAISHLCGPAPAPLPRWERRRMTLRENGNPSRLTLVSITHKLRSNFLGRGATREAGGEDIGPILYLVRSYIWQAPTATDARAVVPVGRRLWWLRGKAMASWLDRAAGNAWAKSAGWGEAKAKAEGR